MALWASREWHSLRFLHIEARGRTVSSEATLQASHTTKKKNNSHILPFIFYPPIPNIMCQEITTHLACGCNSKPITISCERKCVGEEIEKVVQKSVCWCRNSVCRYRAYKRLGRQLRYMEEDEQWRQRAAKNSMAASKNRTRFTKK